MYYIGDKNEIRSYDDVVSAAMGLNGNLTKSWSLIFDHPTENKSAILINSIFTIETLGLVYNFDVIDGLGVDWYNEN